MAGFTREENLREAQALADLFFTVYESPKPVVARVHGAALGGGAGLVAACDIPVAALGHAVRLHRGAARHRSRRDLALRACARSASRRPASCS